MSKIVWLNGESELDKNLVGGKAYNLNKLAGLEFDVPKAFVITTKLFEKFKRSRKFDKESIFEIKNEFKRLKDVLGKKEIKVAVRSSAVGEDGTENSFAGQMESFLNVDEKGLIKSIQNCLNSVFSKEVQVYCKQKKLKLPKMAVVVQEMLQPKFSGVGFSVHPVSKNANLMVIEIVRGFGEKLVSGEVLPNSYIIRKDSLKIINRIEHKKISVDDETILEVARKIKDIEMKFSYSCDIEFAYVKSKNKLLLKILQSRPITMLDTRTGPVISEHQVSMTEWYSKIGSEQDSSAFRKEDNRKDERLEILGSVIGLEYERQVEFEAIDLAVPTKDFKIYLEENKHQKCALRLIPKEDGLAKLRNRGLTHEMVYKTWFLDLQIDHSKYKACFRPHIDESPLSIISIVNEKGIFGEIVVGGHSQLTQGQEYSEIGRFYFNFKTWTFHNVSSIHKVYIKQMIQQLFVKDRQKQKFLADNLNSRFVRNYLEGYFEAIVWDDGVIRFSDYNRLTYQNILPSNIQEVGHGKLSGIVVSDGGREKYIKGWVVVATEKNLHKLKVDKNTIVVTKFTDVRFIELMQKAGGLVTEMGGMLSHAAIIARELKLPCVVGVKNILSIVKMGDEIIIDVILGKVKIISK